MRKGLEKISPGLFFYLCRFSQEELPYFNSTVSSYIPSYFKKLKEKYNAEVVTYG